MAPGGGDTERLERVFVLVPEEQTVTVLCLVRHGQSTWNAERRIQGQLDPPLSELGRAQANRVAERLARERWDVLYSSDLSRARQTAEAIARRQPRFMSRAQWQQALARRMWADQSR